MDFRFRPDVDAARRFVDDQHARARRQPFRQQDFLLIAARQGADRALQIGSFDRQVTSEAGAQPLFDRTAHQTGGGAFVQTRRDDVRPHALRQEQSLIFAVFGRVDDAEAQRAARRIDSDSPAVNQYLPAVEPGVADRGHHRFSAPRTDQSGKPQNLATADRQIHVFEFAEGNQAAHLEDDFAGAARLRRIEIFELASDHHLDDFAGVGLAALPCPDQPPVAQDRDAVGDAEDFVHPVRDVDQAESALGEPTEQFEEQFDLMRFERRRGLVQDEQLRLDRQRLRDLDDLAFGQAEVFDRRVGRYLQLELIEQFLRSRVQLAPIDQAERAEAPRLAPDEDVFGDRQVRREAQFLMHEADAERLGFRRVLRIDLSPVEDNLAAVLPHDSGENLHQRGFARAVFANQRMNLAAPRREVHPRERPRAGEGLGYSAHLKNDGLIVHYISHRATEPQRQKEGETEGREKALSLPLSLSVSLCLCGYLAVPASASKSFVNPAPRFSSS